ncbi:preprotein translocase subunit SecA [Flavitalea sp. BT771]|uniref:preprotein translocase subunit SecA n=1 Tax=Flavitalea sp. BT771 TaxID=3063329 RepID=UPI0026E3DFAA|nr:preprotein translocase subunit SecA [Flavitalea sp. BT771]MDO6429172.1 preprotein translocase subunit SecA [Flavitalea sp. BT771]MDV6218700.1 preprotein translocase subunit SecA [Flavitalea sp. BT771]
MLGILSKIFGGNKSEKDIRTIQPLVGEINRHFASYQSLSNDQLRAKTSEFKDRIREHLSNIDGEIAELNRKAEALPFNDINGKDVIYQEVDQLKKDRDEQIEEVLETLLPEAFAVVKETARRFATNPEIEATATDLDRDLSIRREHVRIEGDKVIFKNSWLAAGSPTTWNMVHYDVQLIGGTVLHQGKIAEMATGEGKTLVSTLPAYLNALAGEGVHIVTVNDYLARRDSEWNGPIFEWLGLTVDCIDKHEPNSESRRKAYLADITYGTNNEFGFDYLRDNMVHSPEEMVQRKHHFAMVDEVDSVLIDDARTPLIISGPVPRGDDQQYHILKSRVEKLFDVQKRVTNQFLIEAKKKLAEGNDDPKDGGLALMRAHRGLPKSGPLIKFLSEPGIRVRLQKSENYYLADQSKEMPKVDAELYFHIDEKNNSVDLTDKGIQMITREGEDPEFFVLPDIGVKLAEIEKGELTTEEKLQRKEALLNDYAIKADRIHTVQQLLKAYTLFDKDVEYVVLDGQVKIVDEQTGRILDGRRYSDGLHQAIEAKENVKIEAATQTYATVTLQNYFRMYHKLAGMTGTAETEASELWDIYKLDVVTIPTNVPAIRKDHQDLVFKTKREKYKAVIDEIEKLRAEGRPSLVGTTSVEVSELLSKMLQVKKIPHNVLNAKQHSREAQVVAEAGLAGAVTIATNMAGRGTDIKLGPGVKEAGGLAIIGTERHESRRVDRQLRGRSARQGDPGTSQFYVSLEDDLMRMFGSDRIASLMDRMGYKEGEVIQHSMVTKSIERAQKKVEENNFGIRKRLLEYDDVMNKQRNVVYKKRNHALFGDRLALDLDNAFYIVAEGLINSFREQDDYEGFKLSTIVNFGIDSQITEDEFLKGDAAQLSERLYQEATRNYEHKLDELRKQAIPVFNNIRATQGNHIQNVVVPFTDGKKRTNVHVSLEKTLASEGRELMNAVERQITLSIIDEAWKEHLRGMDDLKQSVQTAYLEQKDPLVIYKMEAFELFRRMDSEVNKDIVSFLCHSGIYHSNRPSPDNGIREGREQKTDMSKLKIRKDELAGSPNSNNGGPLPAGVAAQEGGPDYYDPSSSGPVKQEPVKVGPKIGRNDPCPCGSGKKFKNCHGKDAAS